MINGNNQFNNSAKSEPPILINAAQAAQTLGISPRNLWTQTKSGKIPFIQLGHRVMYSPALLQAWVNSTAIKGGNNDGKHFQ